MSRRGNRLVWVRIDQWDRPVCILKNLYIGAEDSYHYCKQMPRSEAVQMIRQAVFKRSDGECERCGTTITWKTMQMHERVHKSQGGEVSLSNCWALCHGCHQGRPDSEHGDRRFGGRQDGQRTDVS